MIALPTQAPTPSVKGAPLARATLVLALVLAAIEGAAGVGAVWGARARAALAAGHWDEAQALAGRALAWDPWQPELYLVRVAAWRALGRWDAILQAIPAAAPWHPDGGMLWKRAGEAAFFAGRYDLAAPWLWKALQRNPTPPDRLAIWAMLLRSGRTAWGDADPRVLEAAERTLALAAETPSLDAPSREALAADLAAVFEAAGRPQDAQAARSRLLPNR